MSVYCVGCRDYYYPGCTLPDDFCSVGCEEDCYAEEDDWEDHE